MTARPPRLRNAGRLLPALLLLLAATACAAPPRTEPFQTWQDRRFANVVRQETDFTCGAAALAILSQYYFGRPIAEADFTGAIKTRYSAADWTQREGEGLSLADLKAGAEHFGLKAQGVKLTLDALPNLRGPVIVHLDKSDFKHFAVLRGFDGERVHLADPIGGNVRMPLFRFARQWTGYALLVWTPDQPLPTDYALQLAEKDTRTAEAFSAGKSLALAWPPLVNRRL